MRGEQSRFENTNVPNIPIALEVGHDYVLRDWLGSSNTQQWYRFSLDAARKLNLSLASLYLGVSASLETGDGTVVAATNPSGTDFNSAVRPQAFDVSLPAATYYLRLSFSGVGAPGTPFQVTVKAQ
jgi:hypothetical protein